MTISFYMGLNRNPETGNALQNVRVATVTVSDLLRENQQGVKLSPLLNPDYG